MISPNLACAFRRHGVVDKYCATSSLICWLVFSVMNRFVAVTILAGSSTAFSAFCMQGSAVDMSTSARTGIEPLALLKATWTSGLMSSAARRFCAASTSGIVLLEEDDDIAVGADDRLVFVEPDDAAEVLDAGHAGRRELAARPVAHDLQRGLVGDDEIGRVVPVAVGVAARR